MVISHKTPPNHNYFSNGITPGSELKYVALGTSVTWGQGLDNRNTQTYIKLLSSSSNNLAIRASDASYASLCTQTLLEGNSNININTHNNTYYDVIIIEYERRYEDGLSTLVYRLRKRYPNSIIVLTDIWTFMNIYVVVKKRNNPTTIKPFVSWLKQNGISKNEKQAYDFLKSFESKQDEELTFIFSKMLFDRSAYLNKLAIEYDLRIFSWEKINHNDESVDVDVEDVRGMLLKYLPFYHRDFIHLSIKGHEHAANNIRNIVTNELKKRQSFFFRASSRSSSNMKLLGDWGDGDFCSFWVDNGIIPNTYAYAPPKPSLIIHDNDNDGQIKMIKFDKLKHKYALQFPFLSSSSSSIDTTTKEENNNNNYKLQIINPFNQSRTLSVAYMATGPNTTIYPLTQITIIPPDNNDDTKNIDVDTTTTIAKTWISSKHKAILELMNQWEDVNTNNNVINNIINSNIDVKKQKQSITINPLINTYNYPVHVQLVTTIGIVTPGINIIHIKPLEISNEPFRLVGFAITNNNNFTLTKIFERPSPLLDVRKLNEIII